MYKVSPQYHSLIADGAEQDMLLTFGGLVLRSSKGDFEAQGAQLNEYFNTATDIEIGETPSSTFSCSLMNYDGKLNNFGFGEGRPYIGVRTGAGTWTTSIENPTCYCTYTIADGTTHEFVGTAGRVYIDGRGYASYPNETWVALWVANGYAYGRTVSSVDNYARTYRYWRDTSSNSWRDTVSYDRVYEKMTNSFAFESNILTDYKADGTTETWEFCPMGVFDFDVPSKRQIPVVTISGYDRMVLFDQDAKEFLEGDTWVFPTTLGDIFTRLCNKVGVPFVNSYPDLEVVYDAKSNTLTIGGVTHSYADYKLAIGNVDHSYSAPTLTLSGGNHSFTNSDMSFVAFPTMRTYVTYRNILSLIAEASGNVARFNRDGELELRWYAQIPAAKLTANDIPMDGYDVAEYTVPQITALRSLLADGTEYNIGSGDNVYTILANSFLADDSTRYAPIFTKLQSIGEYKPTISSVIAADPSVEAGDFATILGRDVPLMSQTITWSAVARAVYTATGNPKREIPSSLERNDFIIARNLNDAKEYADSVVDELDQQEIFNRLTNNGEAQGIYLSNGKLYLNAEYMATGVLASRNGKYSLNMDTGAVNMSSANFTGGTINLSGTNGTTVIDNGKIRYVASDGSSSELTNSGFVGRNTSGGIETDIGSSGVRLYDSQGRPKMVLDPTNLSLYDTNRAGQWAVRGTALFESFFTDYEGRDGYMVLDNGLAICWKQVWLSGFNVNTAWGALYESPYLSLGNMSYTFAHTPTVTATITGAWGLMVEHIKDTTNSSWGNIIFCRPTTATNATCTVNLVAYGERVWS